nr:MAG TPA: hypothetical protein [Crassvirales sp.]
MLLLDTQCVRAPNASNGVRGFSCPGVTKVINTNTSNHNQISITHLFAFSQLHVCQSINLSPTGFYMICVRTQWHI